MTTSRANVLGRGFKFPFQLGADGRVAMSEGEANVRESIEIILRTELRERIQAPEFGTGLSAILFEPNTVATRQRVTDRIVKALARHEPRIVVQDVRTEVDPKDGETALATVVYRLVATQASDRVTVAVRVRSGS